MNIEYIFLLSTFVVAIIIQYISINIYNSNKLSTQELIRHMSIILFSYIMYKTKNILYLFIPILIEVTIELINYKHVTL